MYVMFLIQSTHSTPQAQSGGSHSGTRLDMLQYITTHCNTLQHTATCCNTMPHETHRVCSLAVIGGVLDMLQYITTHCNTLQHTATCCNILQQNATRNSPRVQSGRYRWGTRYVAARPNSYHALAQHSWSRALWSRYLSHVTYK